MAYDVVIAGGGVMGCATAYHLKARDPSLGIAVVERDPTYEFASTMLSDGNVRIQFNLEENIRMSQYAMEVLATFDDDMAVGDRRPEVSPRRQGNLFMVDEPNLAAAHEGMERQRSLGCDVTWLSAAEVTARYPQYESVGLVGGTMGSGEGSVDPGAVLHGYRIKAGSLGVDFVQAEVAKVLADGGRVHGVELKSGDVIDGPVVINAAGAWAGDLAATAGVALPIDPVMRTVYVVAVDLAEEAEAPSIFMPTGLYAIPHASGAYAIAWSQPDDPVGYDFTFSRARFDDVIWPEIVRWLPRFDRLRVTGGWAGLYAMNTLDGNAILGEWPLLRGLYLANGFSGHGFQQCHAVGRYLAELITGQTPSLDLSRLGPQRILDRRPVHEHAGRII